jgi:hypothetical protein
VTSTYDKENFKMRLSCWPEWIIPTVVLLCPHIFFDIIETVANAWKGHQLWNQLGMSGLKRAPGAEIPDVWVKVIIIMIDCGLRCVT